jgi:hypothetical protein
VLAYRPKRSAYIHDKVVRQKTTPFPVANRENVVEENIECNDRYVYENVYRKIFTSFHVRVTSCITVNRFKLFCAVDHSLIAGSFITPSNVRGNKNPQVALGVFL